MWDDQQRASAAKRLVDNHGAASIRVGEDQGYAMLPHGAFQSYEPMRARALSLFNARREPDGNIKQQSVEGSKKNPKEYMQSVLCADDFVRYPELLALGLEQSILAEVSRYLGTLPILRTAQIFWTPPTYSSGRLGSQFFHYDHDNKRQLKLFFYLDDMDEHGGPFTFIPKGPSAAVKKQGVPIKGKRYADEEVFRFHRHEDTVQLIGPAGAGAIVDTANCLHYGGRVDHRGRLLVTYVYLRPDSNVIDVGRMDMAAIAGLELDELGRMIVTLPPWADRGVSSAERLG